MFRKLRRKLKEKIFNSDFLENYYQKYRKNKYVRVDREYRKFEGTDKTSNKILLVYHRNFLRQDAGNNAYVFQLMTTLKKLGFCIDFFSVDFGDNEFADFNKLNEKYKLVENFYLVKNNPLYSNKTIYSFFTWCSDNSVKKFDEIVQKNNYRCINIHYANYLDLVKFTNVPANTKIVYTISDFMSMQQFFATNSLDNFAQTIFDEISILKYCDEVTSISFDEKQFFQRFYPDKPFHWLPHFLEAKKLPEMPKNIDCLFVGHSNQMNKNSLIWFLDEVYPHLNPEIKITVCGKVCKMLQKENPDYYQKMIKAGFTIINFAEDLEGLYAQTKISIVPMLSGTGMKIKTVTSMAYGIPVVGTELAVDGFLDKSKSGCLTSNDPCQFAQYINELINNEAFYNETVSDIKEYHKQYFTMQNGEKILKQIYEAD